jgi:hypothetical protein
MLLQRETLLQRTRLLGPAFVAAVAYRLILIVLIAAGLYMRPELVEGPIPAALRQAQRA